MISKFDESNRIRTPGKTIPPIVIETIDKK